MIRIQFFDLYGAHYDYLCRSGNSRYWWNYIQKFKRNRSLVFRFIDENFHKTTPTN